MKTKKQLLSVLLSLVMLLGLVPGMGLTAYAWDSLTDSSTNWTDDLGANNAVTINDNVTVTGDTWLFCNNDVTVNGSLTVNADLYVYGPGKLYVNSNVVINSEQTLWVSYDGELVANAGSGDCITGSGTLFVNGHVTASAGEDGVGIKGVSLACYGTLYGSDAAAIKEENKKDSPYQKFGLRDSVDYESHRYMYVDDGLVDAQTLSAGDTFSADLLGIKNCTSLTLQAGGYATEGDMSSEPTPGTETKIVKITSNWVYFTEGKIMDREGDLSPYANGKVVNFWQVVSNNEGALVLTGYGISHTHNFTYSASGATITATCTATDCPLPQSSAGAGDHVATLTITANGGTYDGTTAYGATITDANSIQGDAKVQYQKKTDGSYGTATETAPKDAGDYKARITVGGATASVEYTIAKAEPTAASPTDLKATYGQTLKDVTLTNPTGNTAGTWSWVDDTTTSVGNAGTNTFKANFTPTDANYNSVGNVDVTVTVSAADPATPTNLKATYGQTLADVTLPGGWAWKDRTTSVGEVGTNSFKADYTATSTNYNSKTDVDVTVTVGKANAVAATVTANNRTYDGTEKPLVTVAGETIGGTLKIAVTTVDQEPDDGAYTFDTTSIPQKTNAGTYYVWYKVKGDANHNDTEPQSLTVIIRNPSPSGGGSTTPETITITIPVSGEGKDAETVNVTVQVTGATATVTSADVDKVLEAKDVGNVTVDVSSLNNSVDEVVLPAALVEKVAKAVADNGNDASGLEIKLPTGTVTFDATTVATLAQQSNGKDLKVHLDNVSQATLTSAQQTTVKDMNALVVLDAYVTADGKRISNFNGGKATFSVPVELKDGQVPEGVAAFFVDEKGNMTEIPCSCDGKNATGTVEHFSNYVITYDESRVTKPEPQPEPEPEPTPGPATPTDIGYDDLSNDQKKDADAVASALGVDKDTAAQMVKLADELGVSIDTVKLSGAALAKMNVDSSDPAGTDFGKLTARVTKRTNSALTLKWTKQKNADGYLIYGNKCGKGNKMKLLKTIKKNGTVSYTQKKLKKGTYYKYMVVAYKNVNGKKMPIAASVVLHAPTKSGKTTVAKSVKTTQKVKKKDKAVSSVSVKKGKSVTLKATENKEDKKLKIKTHRAVKFESSDPKVATVNNSGKITGKKKGSCTVWAYAQNGIFKAVKVTVK